MVNLSKYDEERFTSFYSVYENLCEKVVKTLSETVDTDLSVQAKSRVSVQIYQSLRVWLLKFYKNEFCEALRSVGYDYKDFVRNMIVAFIITIFRSEEKAKRIFDVFVDSEIILDVRQLDDGVYEIVTHDYGVQGNILRVIRRLLRS